MLLDGDILLGVADMNKVFFPQITGKGEFARLGCCHTDGGTSLHKQKTRYSPSRLKSIIIILHTILQTVFIEIV
jgi:hypothetical protein